LPAYVSTETQDGARFQDYWSSLPREGLTPHTRDFLTTPDPALISRVLILEVNDDFLLVRFMGTNLVSLMGVDVTNKEFGAGLPDSVRATFLFNCHAVIGQPCGLHEVTEFVSATGRPFRMETLMLPLAVDEGKPPRICSFSAILEEVETEEKDRLRFHAKRDAAWFDIGSGVPDGSPQYPQA
jgi:hypothetical protein